MMMIELQHTIPAWAVFDSASTCDRMNSKVHVRDFPCQPRETWTVGLYMEWIQSMESTFKMSKMNPGLTANKGMTYCQCMSRTICFMCGRFQLMLHVCWTICSSLP